MSIQLPKYTIHSESVKSKRGSLSSIILISTVTFVLGYSSHAFFTNSSNGNLSTRNTVLEEQNSSNKDKIVQLEAEISLLKTDKKVKKQATTLLQNDYKGILNDNNLLKSEITFYENLLSPNSKKKGLRVFEATIHQINENSYKLKFSIVQKIEKAREISGKYKVFVVGLEKDKSKTITLNSKENSYKFKYFQNVSLDFLLPKGFNATQLVVELFPNNKKAKSIKHSSDWAIE